MTLRLFTTTSIFFSATPVLSRCNNSSRSFLHSSKTYCISGLRTRRSMAHLSVHGKRHKVAVIGSGNWGSTVAKVVAENTKSHPDLFVTDVHMWVYEEQVQIDRKNRHFSPGSALCKSPQKLSELINTLHENVKYLPGITLPDNLIANPDLLDTVRDASILIFNFPHQFVTRICGQLKGNILPYARGFSCIKGVEVSANGVRLISDVIGEQLGIYCGALSGANIASEIALGKWSETTIAYDPPPMDSKHPTPRVSPRVSPEASPANSRPGSPAPGRKSNRPTGDLISLPSEYPALSHENVKALFHRPYFHVHMVSDVAGVALGGALKNIIALAAGFVDGMGWGDNAKAAIMRIGILEMVRFGREFFPESSKTETFTQESAGVADVITSCCGGRNFRCAKMSIERGMSITDVEKQELNGQSLQGTLTAKEVNALLKAEKMEHCFPLFTAVYNILEGKVKPHRIPELVEPKTKL